MNIHKGTNNLSLLHMLRGLPYLLARVSCCTLCSSEWSLKNVLYVIVPNTPVIFMFTIFFILYCAKGNCQCLPKSWKCRFKKRFILNHPVLSNSLQPHGLWPTRLLCPWDFSDKNTGEGYHFLFQGRKWGVLSFLAMLLVKQPENIPIIDLSLLMMGLCPE